MTVQALMPVGLGPALLGHLAEQLSSTERLLESVLRQATAIRARDVETVLAALAEVQTEMERRAGLERVRGELLAQAAAALGVPPHAITLDAMCTLLQPAEALAARERSAHLRGLLAEVSRRHTLNRALMRQELAFLEHLVRLIGGEDDDVAYAPPGSGPGAVTAARTAAHRVLDLQA
ncbi:MAG: flagellar protein FlgN [Actinomycetota bacterium]|nr:flagellar protein FlgN [Actinomycetota bacterium]